MKKLLMGLTLGLVFAGLVGCGETPAEKIEDGTMGLEKQAQEKAAEVLKKSPTDITEEPVAIPAKPKDHPAH